MEKRARLADQARRRRRRRWGLRGGVRRWWRKNDEGDGASVFGRAAGSPVGGRAAGREGELERGVRGADRDSSRGSRANDCSNGADVDLLLLLRTNRNTAWQTLAELPGGSQLVMLNTQSFPSFEPSILFGFFISVLAPGHSLPIKRRSLTRHPRAVLPPLASTRLL